MKGREIKIFSQKGKNSDRKNLGSNYCGLSRGTAEECEYAAVLRVTARKSVPPLRSGSTDLRPKQLPCGNNYTESVKERAAQDDLFQIVAILRGLKTRVEAALDVPRFAVRSKETTSASRLCL